MLSHKRSSLGGRKVSPPQPTCMTDAQKSTYLASLRNSRPSRPTGSRPIPTKPTEPDAETYHSTVPRSDSGVSLQTREQGQDIRPRDGRVDSATNRASMPKSKSLPWLNKGRPLVRPQQSEATPARIRKVSPLATNHQASGCDDNVYHESVTRQLEREEAHSLREALLKIDDKDEERRIHQDAQYEAADLVWKHRNPNAAEAEKMAGYRNPDLEQRKKYGSLDESLHRTRPIGSATARSASDDSNASQHSVNDDRNKSRKRHSDFAVPEHSVMFSEHQTTTPTRNIGERRRSSRSRQVSSGSNRGIFRNAQDQIFEELEAEDRRTESVISEILPLRIKTRNPLLRGTRPLPEKAQSTSSTPIGRLEKFEIYRNPPTQSRNAAYTVNTAPSSAVAEEVEDANSSTSSRALEIRSEEIRTATSMKKTDRSPKLPTPVAVSDRPGRPIVSFDPGWAAHCDSPDTYVEMERPGLRPFSSNPSLTVSAPAVPTLNLPDEQDGRPMTCRIDHSTVPTINLPDQHDVPTTRSSDAHAEGNIPFISIEPPSVPTITVQNEDSRHSSRPLPHQTQSLPPKLPPSSGKSRPAWLQSNRSGNPPVACTSCTLPISGRVVTASGANSESPKARFHPECFSCHHCSTPLECVSFYPEPSHRRADRLEADGFDPSSLDFAQDLRFYCHLDFHEFFSPRCRHCHTPIEGEVIVAAGHEWHAGHFFCGECGDPFDSATPFVERDGYAYCVSCHTKRTSARCRACKRQILDELTVEALGGKWHEQCFVCHECTGDFGPEGRFFVREIQVDLTDKERRRGVTQGKLEERAVCEACEGRRLKGYGGRGL